MFFWKDENKSRLIHKVTSGQCYEAIAAVTDYSSGETHSY